ncbi:MAG: hypothetical protein ACLT3Y_00605 [Ruminococcus callidus]
MGLERTDCPGIGGGNCGVPLRRSGKSTAGESSQAEEKPDFRGNAGRYDHRRHRGGNGLGINLGTPWRRAATGSTAAAA